MASTGLTLEADKEVITAIILDIPINSAVYIPIEVKLIPKNILLSTVLTTLNVLATVSIKNVLNQPDTKYPATKFKAIPNPIPATYPMRYEHCKYRVLPHTDCSKYSDFPDAFRYELTHCECY